VATAIDDADSDRNTSSRGRIRAKRDVFGLFPDRIALGLNLRAEGTLPACAVRRMALIKSLALAKEQVNTVGFDENAMLLLNWPDLSDLITVTLDNSIVEVKVKVVKVRRTALLSSRYLSKSRRLSRSRLVF
jgi:hypothetical protein